MASYHTIVLPSRPQVDTIVSIFVLKRFGEEAFPGVSRAGYEFVSQLPEGESEESFVQKGKILIDIGGGKFDHHTKTSQTTALNLICEFLGQDKNPALTRLKKFVERDDFYGKGIVSTDQLDRAFGLPGLIANLNRKYVNEPSKVIDLVLPIIEAHYEEEEKRAVGMPKELEEKIRSKEAVQFEFKQKGRRFKGILIRTDNVSMAGFLRSQLGGSFDAVAIRLSSGHINVLTNKKRGVDLRSLTVLVRIQEAEAAGKALDDDPSKLALPGKLAEVPNWYFDTATNSLLNGGPIPGDIKPTAIPLFEFQKVLELGLSEKLWTPPVEA